MATESHLTVVSGPGKWEISQALVQILEPDSCIITRAEFTFDGPRKPSRRGRITGIRQLPEDSSYYSRKGFVEIEGYFFNGVSPHEHHGSPFHGEYNPTTRQGWLTIQER